MIAMNLTTPQQLGSLIKSARDIMRKDKGLREGQQHDGKLSDGRRLFRRLAR